MPDINSIITGNIDIWASTVKKRRSVGRGSSKKVDLYGIKKLRSLILELAVRGLLVPQDLNDEPASDLIKRISDAKAELIKDKKIKKQKPLPEIREEEKPFELPKGWEWARLGDIGIGSTGKTPRTKESSNFGGEIPFIGPGQITLGGELLQPEKFLSEEGLVNSTEAKSGDILMVCIGGSIGKSVICDKRIAFNQQINAIRPLHIASSFLHAAVSDERFYQSILDKSTGSATPIINRSKWEELLTPICPEQEQHRIVTKVDELMALCDQLEQQQEDTISTHQILIKTLLDALLDSASHGQAAEGKTKFEQAWERIAESFDTLFTTEDSIDQLKQTILQLAVMGKLVPQNSNDEPASELLKRVTAEKKQLIKNGKIKKQKPLPEISTEEEPFKLPSGWVFTRLDDLCGWITSGSTPPKPEFTQKPGVPYLKVYNIREQAINFDYKPQFINVDWHKRKLKRSILYPGDVVMNIVGPPLCKIAIIPDTYPEWNCNQAIVFFRPIEKALAPYIYTYLTAGVFLEKIELIGTAGQDNISVTKSRNIVFPMPSLNEQSRILKKLDKLMSLCNQLRARINTVQAIQISLSDTISKQAIN